MADDIDQKISQLKVEFEDRIRALVAETAALKEPAVPAAPKVGRPEKTENTLRFKNTLIRFTQPEWDALTQVMQFKGIERSYRSKNHFLVCAVVALIQKEFTERGLPEPRFPYE